MDGYGGGIYCYQVSPTISNCTIEDNRSYYGGGMYNYYCSPIVTNCFFSGNYGIYGGFGGGMYNWGGSPMLTNCTFSENWADDEGGGMYNIHSSPTLINCTFSRNVAWIWGGGGMSNYYSSPAVTNCIFWDNYSLVFTEIHNYSSNPTFSYCDVSGCGGSNNWDESFGIDGGGNIDADPCFVDIDNPAGLDGIFGTLDDGLRLTIDSNCIDAADGNAALSTDILGRGHYDVSGVDNTGTGNPNFVDIGAYEYLPPLPSSVVHFSDLLIAYEYELSWYSEALVEDDYSHILGPGEYLDMDAELSKAVGDPPPPHI
jgi:hypothetical protein